MGLADCRSSSIASSAEIHSCIEAGQGEVKITPHPVSMHKNENGTGRFIEPGTACEQPFQVRNCSQRPVMLAGLRLSRGGTQGAFTARTASRLPARIDPGQALEVSLTARPARMGVLRTTLFFDLDAPGAPGPFSIGRLVTARCGDRAYEDILAPTRPYERARRRRLRPFGPGLVDGVRPPGADLRFKVGLPTYPVPKHLRRAAAGTLPELFAGLRAGLPGSYSEFFSGLLWVEELAMEADIRAYDMERARMTPEGAFLALKVPGLAESRPSVMRGDAVLATPSGQAGPHYRGYAHRVELERVLLCFAPELHRAFVPGQEMDIAFTFRRTPLQLMHHGAAHPPPALGPARLFPGVGAPVAFGPARPLPPGGLVPFNRALNAEQRGAVRRIFEGVSRPAPYVIFGPPGASGAGLPSEPPPRQ